MHTLSDTCLGALIVRHMSTSHTKVTHNAAAPWLPEWFTSFFKLHPKSIVHVHRILYFIAEVTIGIMIYLDHVVALMCT